MYYGDIIVHKIRDLYGDSYGKRKGSTGEKRIHR